MRVLLAIVAPSRSSHLRLPTCTTPRPQKASGSPERCAADGDYGARGNPRLAPGRFHQAGECLPLEQLVPKAPYERLSVGILPRRARLDVEGPHLGDRQPSLESLGYEFGAVVRADERWSTPLAEQVSQGADHILGGDGPLNLYGQALPGVLIHHWHHL